ncbi:23578_t:CDS:2 [Gigaspora rosea]|nr:23578_t:CDS:2 [Gigaspora rosea]
MGCAIVVCIGLRLSNILLGILLLRLLSLRTVWHSVFSSTSFSVASVTSSRETSFSEQIIQCYWSSTSFRYSLQIGSLYLLESFVWSVSSVGNSCIRIFTLNAFSSSFVGSVVLTRGCDYRNLDVHKLTSSLL